MGVRDSSADVPVHRFRCCGRRRRPLQSGSGSGRSEEWTSVLHSAWMENAFFKWASYILVTFMRVQRQMVRHVSSTLKMNTACPQWRRIPVERRILEALPCA